MHLFVCFQIMIYSLLFAVLSISVVDGISLSFVGVSKDQHVQYAPRKIGIYYDLMPQASSSTLRTRRDASAPASITSLHVLSRITSRFSETVVTSVVSNPTEENKEAVFNLEIPEKAFISNFTMLIDGQLIVAEVASKDEADKLYEEARKKNQTAGKVASSSPPSHDQPLRGMERFIVSIAVKADSSIVFDLTYLQLLERINSVYEQTISMRPGQVVPDFKVDVYVYDKQGVKDLSVFEPTIKNANTVGYQIVEVDEVSDKLQYVSFHPTADQQRQMDEKIGVDSEFIVSYDVEHPDDAGLLQIDDKFFAHYFSPEESQYTPLDKHIIFVIDISGSMSGNNKMKHTRDAFITIIRQLREKDTFLLLLFDDEQEYWPSSKEPVHATEANKNTAVEYAKGKLYADGGTNIADAVTTACRILREQNNPLGSNLVMFLTDGEPTAGETDSGKITSKTLDAAAGQVTIYSLAFGYNLDYGLLEMLSYKTGGIVVRIYDSDDATKQLTEFYSTIGTPIMRNIDIEYPNDIVKSDTVTETHFMQHFTGSELVIVGQLVDTVNEVLSFEATVKAEAQRSTSLPAAITLTTASTVGNQLPAEVAAQEGFIEKLWVYKRIKHLLKEIVVADDAIDKELLEAEALNLALEYRLVTPLTSMIIVQPDFYDQADGGYGLSNGVVSAAVSVSMGGLLCLIICVIIN